MLEHNKYPPLLQTWIEENKFIFPDSESLRKVDLSRDPLEISFVIPSNYKIPTSRIADRYPARQVIADTSRPWTESCPDYSPPTCNLNNKNLDSIGRTLLVDVPKDLNEMLLNPLGRTGITGKGFFFNFGGNKTVDICLFVKCNDEMKILLIQKSEFGKLGIPGGFVDPGESFGSALSRELKEETGISVDSTDMLFSYAGFINSARNTDLAWHETLATVAFLDEGDERIKKMKAEDPEIFKLHLVAINELPDLDLNPAHKCIIATALNQIKSYRN